MAIMMGRLYAALRDANVPEDKATAAAEEVAGFEHRLAEVKTTLAVLQWMVGTHIALSVAIAAPIIWLLLRVSAKVGAF